MAEDKPRPGTKEYRKRYYDTHSEIIISNSTRSKKKAINEKRFYCEEHDVAYPDNTRLQRHYDGYQHNREKKNHVCLLCKYKTRRKDQFRRHETTNKHKYNLIKVSADRE